MASIMRWLPISSSLLYAFVPLIALLSASVASQSNDQLQISNLTLQYYRILLANSDYIEAFRNSLIDAFSSASISVLLGFISALSATRNWTRKSGAIALLITFPCLMPPLVTGFAFLILLRICNLAPGLGSVTLIHIGYSSPFAFALLRMGLRSLNRQLETAAANLGANRAQILTSIILPQMLPSLIAAFFIAFLISWDEFVLAWFVGGFDTTLPMLIYGATARAFDSSLYALGVLLSLFSVVVCAATFVLLRPRLR